MANAAATIWIDRWIFEGMASIESGKVFSRYSPPNLSLYLYRDRDPDPSPYHSSPGVVSSSP